MLIIKIDLFLGVTDSNKTNLKTFCEENKQQK